MMDARGYASVDEALRISEQIARWCSLKSCQLRHISARLSRLQTAFPKGF
jgi:hypothetical protein